MLHNSLHVADRLRDRNANAIVRRSRDPHRFIRRESVGRTGEDEMELAGEWSVTGSLETPGMTEAITDLSDFLRCMAVNLREGSNRQFELKIDSKLHCGTFRLTAQENHILVSGQGMAEIWSGLVYAEKHMAERKGPYLPLGERIVQPKFAKRISQPPYGANFLVPHLSSEYLSDDAFRLLVHYGINGMLIYGDWLCYVKSDRFPELNHPDYDRNMQMLRDAACRAMRFGVQLYYVPVGPKLPGDHPLFRRRPDIRGAKLNQGMKSDAKRVYALCTSHEEVLAFHGETLSGIAQEVPELGGLVLIVGGEAFKHCYMRADLEGLPAHIPTNCTRCAGRNPEKTVSGLVDAVSSAVRPVNSNVEIIVWEYSAHLWTADPNGMELVRRLPQDISLLTTLDKGEWLQKDGYRKHIWDYSVEYSGPAGRVLEQIDAVQNRDMRYFIKTETAIGLECIQFPYMPALQRLGEKWERLKELAPSGVVQSWFFFGMWGSRAEELGWWAAWHPELSVAETVARIAERDFGSYAGGVIQVWEKMSEAVGHLPYIAPYFRGPQFLGPAHPLYFGEAPEEERDFYKGCWFLPEHEETFSRSVLEIRHSLLMTELPPEPPGFKADEGNDPWTVVFREFDSAIRLSRDAWQRLEAIIAELDRVYAPAVKQAVLEERTIVEAVHRTFASALHILQFLHCKMMLPNGSPAERSVLREQMKTIAGIELRNAMEAVPLYEAAPWLELCDRLEDGIFPSSTEMIRLKIASIQKQLNREG